MLSAQTAEGPPMMNRVPFFNLPNHSRQVVSLSEPGSAGALCAVHQPACAKDRRLNQSADLVLSVGFLDAFKQ